MEFPVFSGLAPTYVESTEKFYLWTSLDFGKRIAYCLIKRHHFQTRKEAQGIQLLKELCHFPEIVPINLWVTCETGRGQPWITSRESTVRVLLSCGCIPSPVHYTQDFQGPSLTLLFSHTGIRSDLVTFRSHPHHPCPPCFPWFPHSWF